jgi:hypothetical protein
MEKNNTGGQNGNAQIKNQRGRREKGDFYA